MRILIDTNILFSALLFPQSKPARVLLYIAEHHNIVLCDRNIEETKSGRFSGCGSQLRY